MRKLLLSVCLCFFSVITFAQKVKNGGVETVQINNIGTIEDQGKVTGYFTFFKGDKVDKKSSSYYLKVSDANLKEKNTIEIIKEKNIQLVTAKFNGDAFMFVFMNGSKKSIEFVTYDINLKQTGSIIKEKLKTMELMMYYSAAGSGYANSVELVVPVYKKGFMVYNYKKDDKIGYKFIMYTNTLKEIWTNESPEDKKLHFPNVVYQDSDKIGIIVTTKDKLMSKKFVSNFTLVSVATGKETASTEIVAKNTANYTLNTPDVIFNAKSNEFLLFGEYLEPKANIAKDPTLGFYALRIATSGGIKDEQFSEYKSSVNALLSGKDKEKFDSKTKFLIQDYIITADNNMFVVGEIYKKAVDGLGVAMKILSAAANSASGGSGVSVNSNTAVIKLVVTDLIVFQFDKNLEMKKIDIFEKGKTSVSLPEGYGTANSRMLSIIAKQNGAFDFEYAQLDEKGETFDLIYVDREKVKGEKAKDVVAAVKFNAGKYSISKIELDSSSDMDVILPSSKGSVYIGAYYRKEKSYEASIEKFGK